MSIIHPSLHGWRKVARETRPWHGIACASLNQDARTSERGTYRWGLKMRLILEAWSFSQSRSSSPGSMPNFLLLGLMGGGPVRWLVRADATGMVCILGSPRRAASPTPRGMMSSPSRRNVPASAPRSPPARPLAKLLPVESFWQRETQPAILRTRSEHKVSCQAWGVLHKRGFLAQ